MLLIKVTYQQYTDFTQSNSKTIQFKNNWARDSKQTLFSEDKQMANKHMKDVQHHLSAN